jgi:hypothetical protein
MPIITTNLKVSYALLRYLRYYCKARADKAKPSALLACTIYTIPHSIINVFLIILTFWLLGVAGADLRPNIIIDKHLARGVS